MELWILLTLCAIGINIGLSVTDKYIVSRASIPAYMLLIGIVGLLSLSIPPLRGIDWPTQLEWTYGILLGIAFCFIIYASFRAFAKEEVSRLVPLSIFSTILITIGAAVFYGERLNTQQLWAFALFLIGALLLATRLEYKVQWFKDISEFEIQQLPNYARKFMLKPTYHAELMGRRAKKLIVSAYQAARNPAIPFLQEKRKVRVIKGLGWYLLAIGISVPYALLAKEYYQFAGAVDGFVAIRVGLCVGAVLIAFGNGPEILDFLRARKIVTIATVKELFGMASHFMGIVAITLGPLSLIRSMSALESVGVFLVSLLLARYRIIQESLRRRDLIQKSIGVACVACATMLLFI